LAVARSLAARCLAFAVLALPAVPAGSSAKPAVSAPVIWYEDDRSDIPSPSEREPNLGWDGIKESFVRPLGRQTHPGRLVRRAGTLLGGDHVPPAANVNRLDEVPNSTWFTNRIGLVPFTPEQAARGPGDGTGPAPPPWTVIRAKTEGVTPGFTMKDSRGGVFFVKFDPPGLPHIASAAGAISGRILHAAGYNVPDDGIVTFRREDLVLGKDVSLTLPDGRRRAMTDEDLEAILRGVDSEPDGTWRVIVSRRLEGMPIGPFDYRGRRKDDPNDRVNHEDRRELRGLAVFAAWINHFDTKQHNSLDMVVEEGGRHFVRHYLIDFASTLGTGASDVAPRLGWEFSFDAPSIAGRLAALGLHEDAWRRLRRPAGLPEVGYFESEIFDPAEFKPLVPNTAFANLTDRDGYWAAKIITAFTDEHLRAIAATGCYSDPQAAVYMARTLGERRDEIGRHWFDRVAPLDFFTVRGALVEWHDLGAERGLYPGTAPRYRARSATVREDGGTGDWSAWTELDAAAHDLAGGGGSEPLRALECQVDRGRGWGSTVRVLVDLGRGRIAAVER
jgi:hypothetical protein